MGQDWLEMGNDQDIAERVIDRRAQRSDLLRLETVISHHR